MLCKYLMKIIILNRINKFYYFMYKFLDVIFEHIYITQILSCVIKDKVD